MIYTPELIKEVAPSVFATSPSPKVSSKYVFVPTDQILENFEREGWNLASVKQMGRGQHALHELRFRNGELPKVGDSLVEAIIRNSHNGMATFSVSAGLHRLVCSNGLTVPTSVAESFNVRHQKFDLEDAKRLTESFAKRLPMIQSAVDGMMSRELKENERINFIEKAVDLRWKAGSVPSTLDVMSILDPQRDEDKGNNLWNVFNVVQEKFVRGGVEYTSARGRKTGLRGLKNIMAVNQVNTKLWELASEFC